MATGTVSMREPSRRTPVTSEGRRSVMAGSAENPAMPAGRHIAARPRIGLLGRSGGEDPLLLNQNRAGVVAALFVLPNPRGDVFDGIHNVLRPVIADHAVRPLGSIAAD